MADGLLFSLSSNQPDCGAKGVRMTRKANIVLALTLMLAAIIGGAGLVWAGSL
jgi:hypothetical protein